VAATIDSNTRTKDSTNHLADAPKEETMQAHHRCPNRSLALGFPPLVEAGKNEHRHDDVSKEVMVPAGVAVVRITQGFHLALPSTPIP
jgi:hypothetical protein